MINLTKAKETINQYKYDYLGYLVIVDQIRTKEILFNNETKKMQEHLKLLKDKYKDELSKIAKLENNKLRYQNIYRMNKKQLVDELTYIYHRLPAVGYFKLGLEKQLLID